MSVLIIHSVGLERAEQNETIHILRQSRKRRTLITAWVYAAAAPCIFSDARRTMPANMQLVQTHWQISESYPIRLILIGQYPSEKEKRLAPFSVSPDWGFYHAMQVCNMLVRWQLVCLFFLGGPCLRPQIAEIGRMDTYRRWMEYSVWICKSTL